ncbi:hypothetical protein NUACC21_09480 [Scytonema sp. NUACC21]
MCERTTNFSCDTRLATIQKASKITVYYMEKDLMKKMKRDVQGKFAIKDSDYREVRSIRLTDYTWKALGIASECLGLTRADYLEHIARHNNLPSITREENVETKHG